jgi:sirohydrochlorin cobaltochelatase
MKTIVVLAMHGSPPRDFPRDEMLELFRLHGMLEHGGGGPQRASWEQRHAELDAKMRAWPRTSENDPFYAGAQAIADELGRASGHEVILGFNEFCAPSLDQALDQAIARGAKLVLVVTPMMTRGGEHAEVEIPEIIQAAQTRHPNGPFVYVWPFDAAQVAQFLTSQIEQMTSSP